MMLYGATGGFNYRATVVCNYGQMQAIFMGMALLALVGCASVPVPTPTPADSRSAPAETPIISGEPPVVVRPRENITPQAGVGVLAMLQKADGHVQAHKLDLAIATLERALRLEPRNPWIWNRLAVVHLQQKNRQQAVHMATKSSALIGDDHPLRAQNDRIIAKAHQ